MVNKFRHSLSRKRKHRPKKYGKRKCHTHRKRRGGSHQLEGAPLDDSLSGSWSSNISLGQGQDYFKYHEGQHGGQALSYAPLSAIDGSALPASMRGQAHLNGIDQAMDQIRGLSDMNGGKRRSRKRSKRSKRRKSHKHKRSCKHNKRSRKRSRKRGGALQHSPYPSQGMLLDSYANTGMNPQWRTAVEFTDAAIRDTQ